MVDAPGADRPPLYFEDCPPGARFVSEPAVMERDRLVAFAREFDPQPQHLDEQAAAGSLFGTLVASGWHTAALTMRMQLQAVCARFPGGAVGAQIDELRWPRPVYPGERLRAVVEVLDARPSRSRPDKGLLRLRVTTLTDADDLVLDMTAAVLVARRPGQRGR